MTIEKYGNNRERFINDLMNLMVPNRRWDR
jgi:hypothetical protein